MRGPTSGGARDLAWAAGLAWVLLAAMLWWMVGQQAASAQALSGAGTQSTAESVPLLRRKTLDPAWSSTEPVSRTITEAEMSTQLVWSIPQYGVTVTFPAGWLGPLPSPVLMTFTPELPAPLPSPASATTYFYDLRGRYDIPEGGEVSLSKAITVEIQYDESGLGSAGESTLRAYWSCCSQTNWVLAETRNGISRVDAARNLFQLTFKSLGHVGLGGYRSQSFMPLVMRRWSRASSLSSETLEP